MIQLRSQIIRGTAPGNWRADTQPLTRWPDAPRYCATCGCRLRRTNRAKVCDPCDDKQLAERDAAAAKRLAWLRERGL